MADVAGEKDDAERNAEGAQERKAGAVVRPFGGTRMPEEPPWKRGTQNPPPPIYVAPPEPWWWRHRYALIAGVALASVAAVALFRWLAR